MPANSWRNEIYSLRTGGPDLPGFVAYLLGRMEGASA